MCVCVSKATGSKMTGICVHAVILTLLSVMNYSKGDYRLEVFVNHYENPQRRTSTGQCCDSSSDSTSSRVTECGNECDNQFLFCVRPYAYAQQLSGDLSLDSWECPLGRISTAVALSSDDISFVMGEENYAPFQNPLVFNGTVWPGGFQLATRVDDHNGIDANSDFVDIIIAEQMLGINNRYTAALAFRGIHGRSFLYFNFRLTCALQNGGPNCTDSCGLEGCGNATPEDTESSPESPTLSPEMPSNTTTEEKEGELTTSEINNDNNTIINTSQDTDASNMPTIVGSAVGVGLFATLLLLMLGVGVVVAKKRFSQSKYEDQEELHNDSRSHDPHENPTYVLGAEGKHISVLPAHSPIGLDLSHDFTNPLYNECSGGFKPTAGVGLQSSHRKGCSSASHEYDYIVTVPHIRVSPPLDDSFDHRQFEGSHYELIP